MELMKSVEKSGLLLEGIIEIIRNETKKKQSNGFIGILLGTLGTCLLENILAGKGY